jgi:hypothetical protein
VQLLNDEFAKETPLSITRGKVHESLGMKLDYTKTGKVKIMMTEYVKNMLTELPEDMEGTAPTPAGNHLFTVNKEATKLSEDDSIMFHHNTAKLLFLCKRVRPDIQTAVAFLITRVKGPDEDDYKKLLRVMKYLCGTMHMPLSLEADDNQLIKWLIDASFAVHPDKKGHTGGVMSLDKGGIYGTSTRQKLVTKSLTEAELVGVSDVLPQVLRTRNFLTVQGYHIKDSVVYQDNKSVKLL